jgi:hypothetical protein
LATFNEAYPKDWNELSGPFVSSGERLDLAERERCKPSHLICAGTPLPCSLKTAANCAEARRVSPDIALWFGMVWLFYKTGFVRD